MTSARPWHPSRIDNIRWAIAHTAERWNGNNPYDASIKEWRWDLGFVVTDTPAADEPCRSCGGIVKARSPALRARHRAMGSGRFLHVEC